MDLAEAVATPGPSLRKRPPAEEDEMLREDGVREVLARLQRGERIKPIARDLGVARNTVKRWQQLGGWRPRPPVTRPCQIAPYRPFVERRGPEVKPSQGSIRSPAPHSGSCPRPASVWLSAYLDVAPA